MIIGEDILLLISITNGFSVLKVPSFKQFSNPHRPWTEPPSPLLLRQGLDSRLDPLTCSGRLRLQLVGPGYGPPL